MGIFTFDWSQISYMMSPLVSPWWAEVNVFAAFVVMFWIVAPAMYYTNVRLTSRLFMRTAADVLVAAGVEHGIPPDVDDGGL